jgi:hypothetical protein
MKSGCGGEVDAGREQGGVGGESAKRTSGGFADLSAQLAEVFPNWVCTGPVSQGLASNA